MLHVIDGFDVEYSFWMDNDLCFRESMHLHMIAKCAK